MAIKNVIFDVGDVLLEYRWLDVLREAGLDENEAKRVGEEIFADELWDIFDRGDKPYEQLIEAYASRYPDDEAAIRYFLTHGEDMHIARPAVWEKMKELKAAGYGIYLLSNYSEYLFETHTKNAGFWPLVDGAVVSYQIHVTKPDAAIYKHLLDTYNLQPSECIFLDDREANTKAAEALGIAAVTITSAEHVIRTIEDIMAQAL